jgi:hypothetical protein
VPACGETIATSRRLADIRRARDRDHQSLAQAFTSALCRKHFLDFAEQRPDLRQRRRHQLRRHIALIGEIDAGFDQCRSLNDLCAPVTRLVPEQTFQLAQRLAALPIGVGMNEIIETLRLGEIELAVLEGAAGKFAGLRRTHILET